MLLIFFFICGYFKGFLCLCGPCSEERQERKGRTCSIGPRQESNLGPYWTYRPHSERTYMLSHPTNLFNPLIDAAEDGRYWWMDEGESSPSSSHEKHLCVWVAVLVLLLENIFPDAFRWYLWFCPPPQRVEMASEFAVSEVLTSGTNSRAMALQSAEQLQDHDDAYSEGRFMGRI